MAHAPKPRRNLFPLLVGLLAIAAVLLIVAGRVLGPSPVDKPGWQDALYTVLLAFSIDGTFLGEQNALTLVGAIAAPLALYLALAGSLWLVFRRRLIAWWAARQRGHVVIVGDGADAAELARAIGDKANVVLATASPSVGSGILEVSRPTFPSDLIAATGINRARSVVVMLEDERANAAIATAIAGDRADDEPTIWCRTGDRVLADRLSAVEAGASRILVFDEAQIVARELFAHHPAHAIAERMAADRVHLLVIGFGRLGHAVAEEAVFSGIAHGLAKPMVTVVDRNASAAETLYRQARPALDTAADFTFIDAEVTALENAPVLSPAVLTALAARDDIARVTAIVICLGSDADNVRVALALPEIRRREGRYFAPAFMRLRDPATDSAVFASTQLRVLDPSAGVQALERATRLMASDVLDTAQRDQAARRLHESYSAGEGRSAAATTNWNNLEETYRRANRRGADHIAAKLFSIGLTSEHEAHEPILVERNAHRRLVAPLQSDEEPRLAMLAALEHRRWSADRVMDGWSYAAARDDDRKHHPLLQRGDYWSLDPVEQRKDRQQIRTVLSSIVVSDGKGAMPEIRVALAGHRNLDAAEQARALGVMLERLVPRLGSLHQVVTLVSPLAPGADIALCEALAADLVGKVGELRLIVPEAVPYRVVLNVAAREEGVDAVAFAAAMVKRRNALFSRFARVDVVRLGFAGRTDDSYARNKEQFELALARANAYMVRRTDLLCVLWDGQPTRGRGGTGELVTQWRNPDSLPAEVDVGISPVRPSPADREACLVHIPVSRAAAH